MAVIARERLATVAILGQGVKIATVAVGSLAMTPRWLPHLIQCDCPDGDEG
jgi:hypothetical protein